MSELNGTNKKLIVRHIYNDPGNYRIYFRSTKPPYKIYCTQPDLTDKRDWYVCSADGEPSHKIKPPYKALRNKNDLNKY